MNPFQCTDQHASECYVKAIAKYADHRQVEHDRQVKEAHAKVASKYGQVCQCEICNS